MDQGRGRHRLFLLLYAALLLFALAWVRLEYVRVRVAPNGALVDGILVAGLCYVGLRAYLVLVKGAARNVAWLWLGPDLALITVLVHLTGGVRSMAALAYLIPILTASISLKPRDTALAGLAGGLLYVLAVWHRGLTAAESGWLVTGLFFLAVVTVLAYWYAVTERARVDEMTSLREQVALADYRSALSQELHDGVQHYLVAAVVRLEMARKVGEQDASQAVDMAVNVRHTLRQASDELRYLVRRLRSPHIERHGFLQALREHLSLYAEHAPFTVDLQVEAEEAQLPPEVEQIAFRIIQEALINAEKHASPTEVRVSVRLTPERLECSIGDNGSGFEPAEGPEQPDLTHGLGLAGMRHRAESVDGKLEVESAPGAGTRVRLTVPVAQYVAHKEEQVAKYQGAPG